MDNKYTEEQVNDAKELARILSDVPTGKRSLFSLMLESLMIGAELAEAGPKSAAV